VFYGKQVRYVSRQVTRKFIYYYRMILYFIKSLGKLNHMAYLNKNCTKKIQEQIPYNEFSDMVSLNMQISRPNRDIVIRCRNATNLARVYDNLV
jgi:hypothetical protein